MVIFLALLAVPSCERSERLNRWIACDFAIGQHPALLCQFCHNRCTTGVDTCSAFPAAATAMSVTLWQNLDPRLPRPRPLPTAAVPSLHSSCLPPFLAQTAMADLPASQELVPSQEPAMPVMPAGRNTRGRAQTKKTRVGGSPLRVQGEAAGQVAEARCLRGQRAPSLGLSTFHWIK